MLHAGSLDGFHALRADRVRLAPVIERLMDAFDVMPEEREAERAALGSALHDGRFYEGRSAREQKVLDRMIVRTFLHEVPLSPLTPGHYAYRYEWVLAFLERHAFPEPAVRLWGYLAHGRRFGAGSGTPEMVPYYAWLAAGEVRELSLAVPGLLETMERERAEGGSGFLRSLRRRGAAHDAAFWLVKEVAPVLDEIRGSGEDLVALTGSFRGLPRREP